MAVMWFRRDLRLGDNPALVEAARSGPVRAVFILDPALVGSGRIDALTAALAGLDASCRALGGQLVVRRGVPAKVLVELVEAGEKVYASDDVSGYSKRRDQEVADALSRAGSELVLVGSAYMSEPGSVLTASGGRFKVFGGYFRAWSQEPSARPDPEPVPRWKEPMRGEDIEPSALVINEDEARAQLEDFRLRASDYERLRNLPGVDGTSGLSVHLKWGTIHPRTVLAGLGSSSGEEAFRRQLAWRDFYADTLERAPSAVRHPLDPRFRKLRVDTDEQLLARWKEGSTGFELVDAGMRQLATTGWMHNRVRMVTASFLVKDLHLPWQWGAEWFKQQLLDAEPAANALNWQWVAGCGTDSSPFFRVFNPTEQARKFDPDRTYVNRYVPELVRPGRAGYPAPMVDHQSERREALRRFAEIR